MSLIKLKKMLYQGGLIILPYNCVKFLYAINFNKTEGFNFSSEDDSTLKEVRDHFAQINGLVLEDENEVVKFLEENNIIDFTKKIINYESSIEKFNLDDELYVILKGIREGFEQEEN